MSPISAIPQTLSPYGIQPQMDVAMPGAMPRLPGVDGVTEGIPGSLSTERPSSDAFGSLLNKLVQDVNAKQVDAHNAVASLQSGGNVSLHQAVIAMEEANISFQLMVEVRNKLLEAYQELMRMQV